MEEENEIIIFLTDLLKNPKGTTDIENARKIDLQTSFLTDRMLSSKDNEYSKTFIQSVSDLLNNTESTNKFKANYKFPLEINGFSSQIYEKLSKIWDGQNKSISISPANNEYEFSNDFYKNELFEYYYKTPNTLVLVYNDLDGNFKHLFINSKDLISFENYSDGEFKHVLFSVGSNFWYFDKSIIVEFRKEKNGSLSLIDTVKNEEGKVNIFHVSNEKYNLHSDFVRTNKLGNYLTEMVFLQMLYIFGKITDPYSFFLIIQKFADDDCNFRDAEANILCSGGYLYQVQENNKSVGLVDTNNSPKKCPSCNQSDAPGSVIRKSKLFNVGTGSDKVEQDMLSFIAPPVDSLEYAENFLKNYEKELLSKICGENRVLNSSTHNVESVMDSREGQETVLINLKTKFESIVSNIEKVKLNSVSNVTDLYINLGTYFLVADIQTLYAELEEAQKNNPENVQKIKERIIETENQTDYPEKKRALILLKFYPNVTELMLPYVSEKMKQKQGMYYNFLNWYELKNIKIGYDANLDIQETLIKLNAEFDKFLAENEVNTVTVGNPI